MNKGLLVAFGLLAFYVADILALDICAGEPDGSRLPHPFNCEKLVVCRSGRKVKIASCPKGLHFNRHLGECDLKSRAGCALPLPGLATVDTDCNECCSNCNCGGNTQTPPTSEVTTDCPETEPTPPTVGPTTPTVGPTTPTVGPTTPTVGPTTPTVGPTTPTVGPTTPTVGSTTPTVGPTTPTVGPTTPTVGPTSPSGNGCSNDLTVCEGERSGSVHLYEGDCNRYVVCTGSCAVVMQCPGNLQFNLEKELCDYPTSVNCPWPTTPAPGGGNSCGMTCAQPGSCTGKKDGTILPDDSNKNGYIVCKCECGLQVNCPSGLIYNSTAQSCDWPNDGTFNCPDGLVFNATINACDWPAGSGGNGNGSGNISCNSTNTICQNQEEGILFPVEGECNKFYKCNYGCAVEQVCPNNLIYNSNKQYCDYPQNYKCPWPYTPPSGPNAGPSGIACESNGRCAGQNEGTFLASQISCGNYVICQCECEVEMSCPNGLYFDVKKNVCNYPAQVQCNL